MPLFEGPLAMLLDLVERRRLPIAEVSLATVADQYLAQVRAQDGIDEYAIGEFMDIAGRLLVIKSRSLLPAVVSVSEPSETSSDDLLVRLGMYSAFRSLAAELAARDERAEAVYPRGARSPGWPNSTGPSGPLARVPASSLARLATAIRARVPADGVGPVLDRLRTTVVDRVALIRERLTGRRELEWLDIAGGTVDQVVASMLAVLEMVRRGELQVCQADLFGPIRLRARQHPTISRHDGAPVRQA